MTKTATVCHVSPFSAHLGHASQIPGPIFAGAHWSRVCVLCLGKRRQQRQVSWSFFEGCMVSQADPLDQDQLV